MSIMNIVGLVGNSINVLKDFKIDVKSLVLGDWINLVKPSDLVQLPLLRTALKLEMLKKKFN